jgi:ribosome-binding factor A
MRRRRAERRDLGGEEDGRRGAGQRPLRVGEALRHALAQILRDDAIRDPALHGADITVSEVRMSPDLKNATVYVMPLGGAHAAEIVAALGRSAPFLRGRLARAVPLRYTPNLSFALDASFEAAERIAAVLRRPEVARDLQPETPASKAGDDAA